MKVSKLLFIVLLLCFTNVLLSKANAQENRTEYYKFGLNLSSDYLTTNNESNSIGYDYKNIFTYNFGINYRIIDKEKYNFTLGIHIRNYERVNYVEFKGIDIPDPQGFGGTEYLSPFTQYKLQTSFNYFIRKGKVTNLYLGIGPELIFYPEDPVTGLFLFTDEEGTEIGYTEDGNSKKSEFYFGVNGTFGLEFKTKYILINPYILYHYEPGKLFESTITTQNLYVSENTVSKHSINNRYWSFGINFYPSKNLFKRKNSKP